MPLRLGLVVQALVKCGHAEMQRDVQMSNATVGLGLVLHIKLGLRLELEL